MADEQQVESTAAKTNKKCSADKCKRPYRAKGYCKVHYTKWRHGELPKPRYKICTKEGCKKPRALGSLCKEHSGGGAETAAS